MSTTNLLNAEDRIKESMEHVKPEERSNLGQVADAGLDPIKEADVPVLSQTAEATANAANTAGNIVEAPLKPFNPNTYLDAAKDIAPHVAETMKNQQQGPNGEPAPAGPEQQLGSFNPTPSPQGGSGVKNDDEEEKEEEQQEQSHQGPH